ncbi:MAG: PLP-dependent cysteine synthase family protein [Candidatus Aenigmatarchaeota archaeon]
MEAIGSTPLIEIQGIRAKLEISNPSGSIKDRMVWHMVKKAEESGELEEGDKIIEATSENTGVSFSMVSAVRGYDFTAVMPEDMSEEKREMMESFGASTVLTPEEEGMEGCMTKYEEITRRNPGAWLPRQFKNPDNVEAHRKTTGREIIEQTEGEVDAFVAGVGTGGTLIGVAKALKDEGIDAEIVAVEPSESAVLSGESSGTHGIEGIGEGFVPKIVERNRGLIDQVVKVDTKKAMEVSRELCRRHGILVGPSSGANFHASRQINKDKNEVVTVLPDSGDRYLPNYEPDI